MSSLSLEPRDACNFAGCPCSFFDACEGRRCWCGHDHSQHAPQPQNPPPRGGIVGRCGGFLPPTARYNIDAICASPGCGQMYIRHGRRAPLAAAPAAGAVGGVAPPFSVIQGLSAPNLPIVTQAANNTNSGIPVVSWQPGVAPLANGSANDRRRDHAQQVSYSTSSAFQPGPGPLQRNHRQRGSSSQPVAHHPYPGPNNSFRNALVTAPGTQPIPFSAASAVGDIPRTYKIVLLPYGPRGVTSFDEIDHFIGRQHKASAPRVFVSKLPEFLARLDDHGLVFEVTVQATLRQPIFLEFHNALVQKCLDKGLTVGSANFSLTKDPAHLSKSIFRLLKGGNAISNSRKLNDAQLEHYDFHAANLGRVAAVIRNPESGTPLLFFAPRCRLDGPIADSTPGIPHPCFAERVMHGFLSSDLDEHQQPQVQCYDQCPKEESDCPGASESAPVQPPLFIPGSPEDHRNDSSDDDDNLLPPTISPLLTPWDNAEPRELQQHQFRVLTNRIDQNPAAGPATPPPTTPFTNPTPLASGSSDALSTFSITNYRGLAPFQREQSPLESPIASTEMQSLLFRSVLDQRPRPPTSTTSTPADTFVLLPLVNSAEAEPAAATPDPAVFLDNMPEVTLSRWELQIVQMVDRTRRRQRALLLEAPTEQAAAQVLFQALLAQHNGTSYSIPDGITFKWDYLNLIGGFRVFKVGRGIGSGVERSVLTQALEDALNNMAIWRPIGDGSTFTLEVLLNRRNAERQASAKAYGSLCALHIGWFRTVPPCISPWLIMLAIHGMDNLPPLSQMFTQYLLQSYNPPLAAELAQWPLTYSPNTNLSPGSPCGNLIAAHLDIQPSAVQQDARSSWDDYTQMLYCKTLFGTTYDVSDCHDLIAFSEGFNLPVNSSRGLAKTFGSLREARHLLALMSQSRLKNVNQLITKIKLIAGDNSEDEDQFFIGTGITTSRTFGHNLQVKFQDCLARYLRGVGHPPASSPYADLITNEMRQSPAAEDPLFRAKSLLRLSTGSTFLPQDKDWKLKIRFILPLPARHSRAAASESTAASTEPMLNERDVDAILNFHSCASEIHVPTTAVLIATLEGPIPTNDIEFTAFDRLMHSTIASFDGTSVGDGFNVV